MPAHALLAHPVEDVLRRPVSAQTDLDEVAPGDDAGLDEPAHRRAVRVQVSPLVVAGVRMCIEVHDAETSGRVRRRNGGRRRPGDGVIAADDHRDDVALRDLADARADRGVRRLGHAGQAHRVAVVDDPQHLEWRDLELEMPLGGLVRRGSHAAWAETGARAVGDAFVPGGADDGDIGLTSSSCSFVRRGRCRTWSDPGTRGRRRIAPRWRRLSLHAGKGPRRIDVRETASMRLSRLRSAEL